MKMTKENIEKVIALLNNNQNPENFDYTQMSTYDTLQDFVN